MTTRVTTICASAKNEFIQSILVRCGFSADYRDAIRRANQTEKRGFEGITYYAPLEIVDMVGCFLVLSLAPFGEATEANLENGGTAPMKKSRNRCDLGR